MTHDQPGPDDAAMTSATRASATQPGDLEAQVPTPGAGDQTSPTGPLRAEPRQGAANIKSHHNTGPLRAEPRPATEPQAAAEPQPAGEPQADEPTEVLDLLHSLMHSLRRESAADGIAPGQMRFLRTLQRAGGAARPGELASVLNLAPRSVTTKVDLAEADGLVRRHHDPTDRRATVVALTDRGTAVLNQVAADRTRGLSARLARLDPADRATLTTLLRRLTDQ